MRLFLVVGHITPTSTYIEAQKTKPVAHVRAAIGATMERAFSAVGR